MAQNNNPTGNAPLTTDPSYSANTSTGDSAFEGHQNSGISGSANTYDSPNTSNTGSYGNTHGTTTRSNPLHPNDPQRTAHPAYGKHAQYQESEYETGGGNLGQGVDGTNGATGGYQEHVSAAPGHSTGGPTHHNPNANTQSSAYETACGTPGQSSTQTNYGTTTGAAAGTTDKRSTAAKVKESASGVKGMIAAVHGAGEKIRGEFNSGVDRAFNEVCDDPPSSIFPSFKTVVRFAELDFPGEEETGGEEKKK
jgi:hypothetical protein